MMATTTTTVVVVPAAVGTEANAVLGATAATRSYRHGHLMNDKIAATVRTIPRQEAQGQAHDGTGSTLAALATAELFNGGGRYESFLILGIPFTFLFIFFYSRRISIYTIEAESKTNKIFNTKH